MKQLSLRKIAQEITADQDTICLDFDGVVAKYSGDYTVIGDPVEGLKEFLEDLRKEGYKVVIHSARDSQEIKEWLQRQNLEIEVSIKKPIAKCYVDDRAIEFYGNFNHLVDIVKKFKTYWE